MTIVLNHTIVPARDKVAAARFFADIFGLPFDGGSGHFAPVRVNDSLTFLFDDDASFESHHYAFHVSDAEFDSIFERIKQAGLAYGSAPWSLDDGKLNDWNGGRGVYFKDPNGHILAHDSAAVGGTRLRDADVALLIAAPAATELTKVEAERVGGVGTRRYSGNRSTKVGDAKFQRAVGPTAPTIEKPSNPVTS